VPTSGAQESEADTDCERKIYSQCTADEIADDKGICRGKFDCDNECPNGGGERKPGLGLCECYNIQETKDVCNSDCQA